MSTDLGLDPSDPLNLLLHNSSQGADSSMEDSGSSEGASPPDWSQLSALWDGSEQAAGLKQYSDLMDFTDLNSLPMDMDFNPAMGMEPDALHFDPLKFNASLHFAYDDPSAFHTIPTELLPPQFPFTFQASSNTSGSSLSSDASSSPESFAKDRRLSVASSSSSSAASASSLSPAPESFPSPATGYASDVSSGPSQTPRVEPKPTDPHKPGMDPAMEIAERVRQSAGVMLAVPMSAQLQSQVLAQSIAMAANPSQTKLPIPRLARNSTAPKSPTSSTSSAASTPPPSTPPMASALPNKLMINTKPISTSSSSSNSTLSTPTMSMAMPLSISSGCSSAGVSTSRPKTSHTTIERRYRTNLNARIQSLRMAVPALRVLEDRDGGNGKKIKKNLKDGIYVKGAGIGIDTEDGTAIDVIDERGFVDGVKVARKCSKANVLGKAVEYIRVLKKREIRLKGEQNGLKALLCGLVGGPALLKEWERHWQERFGGEEKDEVEGEEVEDDDSDEEDGDDGEEEVGKKRKRAKLAAAAPAKKPAERKPAPVPSVAHVITELGGTAPGGAVVPEKRKRGRPRKIVPPPAPVVALAPQSPQHAMPPHAQVMQQDQLMLAVDVAEQKPPAPQYLLAVFAIFSFFNSPLTSSYGASHGSAHQHTGVVLTPPLALSPQIVSQFSPPAPVESSPHVFGTSWAWKDYVQMFHLLVSVIVLGSFLFSWMGLRFKRRPKDQNGPVQTLKKASDGKVDWLAVCNEAVLSGRTSSLSTMSTIQMYHSLSTSKVPSVGQLTSLALATYNARGIFGGLARAKSRSIWKAAKVQSEATHLKRGVRPVVKVSEKLVLQTLDVEEALERLASATDNDGTNGELAYTPIEVLGCMVVKQRVKQHLGQLFVEAVGVSDSEERQQQEKEAVKQNEAEIRRTIDAARELGGAIEELGRMLERVWKSALLDDICLDGSSSEDASEAGIDGEVQALLTALVLYRRLFAGSTRSAVSSMLLSPPPSPTSKSASSQESGALLSLRKALGSRAFEDSDREGEMEDARDQVVDLIVEMERRGRSPSPP